MTILFFTTTLFLLPTTGLDYDVYKYAFDSSYLSEHFPFFETRGRFTSEPLYLFYSSFLGVVLPRSFPLFLSVNFLICVYLVRKAVSNIKFTLEAEFWLMGLAVVLPTIFYASPRSSISFCFVMIGFFKLCESRSKISYLYLFIGIMFHSQYIPVSFCIIIAEYIIRLYPRMSSAVKILLGATIACVILVIGSGALGFKSLLSDVLTVLPSSEVAVSKLHYLDAESKGMRVTSILSIVVFPTFFIALMKRFREGRVSIPWFNSFKSLAMFGSIVLFGAVINVAFITDAHIAGRLARFSDYLSLLILMPTVFYVYYGKRITLVIILIFTALAPFLYPSLYRF